ncbi:hypothetical protein F4560_003349 [Saccharothrix ecbatanensis]|uniref:Recombinase zinc beta ribbon domain-containing protein n=1 Tax=Saccharothrix ecbatanensis TaxID=1105145 RepID=A0A7W9HK66_9PSEU|nr:zinc ribbon domain-containing protein [Saccharothrix ecbatanensis]MBB5803581.1 hypothetical protein [Saccharothrix ecbatanensis]
MGTDRDEVDLCTGRPGQVPNLPQDWAVSLEVVHTPLVSVRDFVEVQRVRARRLNDRGDRREYLLAGLVVCGVCGRRMDAHWVHGRPGYRCRHGYSSARPRQVDRAGTLYWREERLVEHIVGAPAPRQPGSAVASAAVIETLRDEGVEVLCGREAVELRQVPAARTLFGSRWT